MTDAKAMFKGDGMKVGYLDCFAGISGDMFLGALVGAGVPLRVLEDAAAAMNVGATVRRTTVDRSGISSVKIDVLEGAVLAEEAPNAFQQREREPHSHLPETQHMHKVGHSHTHEEHGHSHDGHEHSREEHGGSHAHGRSLRVIKGMIAGAALKPEIKALATKTFELLGASEAKIHNVSVEEIHFHEVGAVDAIVDIVASCAGVIHLGIGTWYSSAVNVGGGMVQCAHGMFPVPAPATADLLRGVPTYSAHVQKELVTPTGAALLRALEPIFGGQPAMRVKSVGYGAGTRNPEGFPNVLRLSVGDAEEAGEGQRQIAFGTDTNEGTGAVQTVSVLETALDDATPQLLGYVTEEALRLGALDVMLMPVVMKKGRPGTLVTVLCDPGESERFTQFLLRETTTLGVRAREDRRMCLDRGHVPVETEYGTIRVKTGSLDGQVLNANAEFEDCRRAAQEHGAALKTVMQAAVAAFAGRSGR